MADSPLARVIPTSGSLPDKVRTRGGTTFDPRPDIWIYQDSVTRVSLNFTRLNNFSDRMVQAAKHTLVWYAENRSASHLKNLFNRLLYLAEFLSAGRPGAIKEITAVDLLSYKSSLTQDTAYYLGWIAGFFKRWHEMGLSGVSDDAFALLNELRIKGNRKGDAVMTMDPEKGPFTDLEFAQIQQTLHSAFGGGRICEDVYLLAWIFMALGPRPSQLAALKVRDVIMVSVAGEAQYALRVPRLKQRNAGPRVEFKERPLVDQIGGRLFDYARRVRCRFEHVLPDPDDAPLFPSGATNSKGRNWPASYEYHQTGQSLSDNLIHALERLEVHSERTGDRLKITPLRFRRTFGTRAAQEGHGELVIAELLDHSDTQNVGVYVAAVPEIAARIDRAVAMQLAPLAQAFKGMLIRTESEATRGNDPSSRIVDARIDRSMRPMGSCGQHSFCGFNAPIACYTCPHFQPWLDGPHEAVLDHLLQKRDQLLATTDARMASVNDPTIFAVAQVIQLCREAQADKAV